MKRSRIAIIVAVLLLSVSGWLWFVRDVPLSDEARLRLAEPVAIPAAENGEYLLWGFDAPSRRQAMEEGIAYANWLSARLLVGHGDTESSDYEPWRGEQLGLDLGSLRMPECSWRSGKDCLPQLTWTVSEAKDLLERNAELLGRYQRLKQFHHFQRVLPPRLDNPLPPYMLVMQTSALLQFTATTTLIHSTDEEERRAALEVIRDEMGYWRSRLTGEHSLISKLVVLAAVRNGTKLINEIVDQISRREELEALLAALPLMTESERDMKSALFDEARLQLGEALVNPFEQDDSLKGRVHSIVMSVTGLYRTNHTVNFLAAAFVQAEIDFSVSANQLLARRKLNADRKSDADVRDEHVWPYYNVIGRAHVKIGQPALLDYAFRIHDCDALIRLVNLKILYALRSESEKSVVDFVSDSGEALRDPYTLEPMRWDENRGELGLTGYADPREYGFKGYWLAVSLPAANSHEHCG